MDSKQEREQQWHSSTPSTTLASKRRPDQAISGQEHMEDPNASPDGFELIMEGARISGEDDPRAKPYRSSNGCTLCSSCQDWGPWPSCPICGHPACDKCIVVCDICGEHVCPVCAEIADNSCRGDRSRREDPGLSEEMGASGCICLNCAIPGGM